MAKVADVRLFWTKSPSIGISKVETTVTMNGTETMTEHGSEVQELLIEVKASTSVMFKVITYDNEGMQATSETYSFKIEDLEAPLPATNLGHEVLAIRNVD